MSQRQRRSFLHWLFFQSPEKRRPKRPPIALLPDYREARPEQPERNIPDYADNVETMAETHHSGAEDTQFRESPSPVQAPNKWIRLAIRSEKVQTVVELTTFPVEIGSVQSSIKLNDKGISPRHAVMDLHTDMLSIVDTHSQNGVSIGDNLIAPGVVYPVFPGDTVIVGSTEITVIDYSRNIEEDLAAPAGHEPTGHEPHADEAGSQTTQPDAQDVDETPSPAALEAPVQAMHESPEAPQVQETQDIPVDTEAAAVKPDQANTTSTIVKLLDEPNMSLFRDVLELGEPPQEAEDPEPERQLTSEDIDESLPEPEPAEQTEKPEPPAYSPILALTAEEFIDALVDESSHAELLPELTLAEQLASMDIEAPPLKAQTDEPVPPGPAGASDVSPVCGTCGTSNEANDKFCGKCGASLKAAPPQVKAFCGQCGAKNEHKTKFCGDCGYKLG